MKVRSRVTYWRLRLGCLLGAAIGIGVVVVVLTTHRSSRPAVGGLSGTALAGGLLTAVTALALLALAVSPAQRLGWLLERFHEFLGRLRRPHPPVSRGATLVLFALALGCYVVALARSMPLNDAPRADQAEYVVLGRQIRHDGGAAALLFSLLSGRYLEANRHPLYPAVLSLVPGVEQTDVGFQRGKWLSAAIGLFTSAVLSWGIARQFSRAVAAITAVLLATNFAFLHATSLVACEGLLVLCSGLIWLTAARIAGLPHDRLTASNPPSEADFTGRGVPVHVGGVGVWPWARLGVVVALAYLTKGSALLLAGGLVLWLAMEGWRLRKGERLESGGSDLNRGRGWLAGLLVAGLAFLLVASPLLVRNVRVYGSPFYNANLPFMFADSLQEGLERSNPSRQPEENESTLAAAQRYWRSHSVGQMVWRAANGLVVEAFILMRSLGPAPLDAGRAMPGGPLLLLALLGMAILRRSDALLVLLWTAILVVFFGWYVPIAAGDRFLLPLLVPLCTYAAAAMVRLVEAFGSQRKLLPAATAWCALWMAWTIWSEAPPARFGG